MSGTVSVGKAPIPMSNWSVRDAETNDAGAVVGAVTELLLELGATPPPTTAMMKATRALIDEPRHGTVLLAHADGSLVGLLSASWQTAIHVPGRYGLIQDLWVDPSWRGRAVGAGLLAALLDRARTSNVVQLEVGLPKESFQGLGGTQAFYEASGFEVLGTRMRIRAG
jgi:GNAT superfamily N-acetyltransferase